MNPGLKQAINVFLRAKADSRAYGDFLKRHGASQLNPKNEQDFSRVPITDKKTFLSQYKLNSHFPLKIPAAAYASSGSSGKPTFWFRDPKQEIAGGRLHEIIFRDFFKIKKDRKTLVIVCFSMGIWVAGNYTAAACNWVAAQGYALTTITPGIEKEDIFSILKLLAPEFETVILCGYPPFVMDILRISKERGIKLPTDLKILTAGDKYSEAWRDAVIKLMGSRAKPTDVINVYGSADAAVLGFETPQSITLRRSSLKNKKLYKALFDAETVQPALFQYDPNYIYFEEKSGELLFTVDTALPLVRYNIHDIGRVIQPMEVNEILENAGEKPLSQNTWPFLIKKGRSDVAVTFYALNIYPEHISLSLAQKSITRHLTGNFLVFTAQDQKHREKLHLHLELSSETKIDSRSLKKIQSAITANLKSLNAEFRRLYSAIGRKAEPILKFYTKNNPGFIKNKNGLLFLNGKKPKILI